MNNMNMNEMLQSIKREGYLEKQSRFLKNWRSRWIVLTSESLMSFKERKNYKSPTETINLNQIVLVKSCDEETHRQASFKIETSQTVFYFTATSNSEKQQWIGQIGRQFLKNQKRKSQ